MPHDLSLLISLAASLAAALALGLATERLRLSPIVGYLLAGVLLGPQTPGMVGNLEMAQQFAEIGVILLMFGVGLHFDLSDLWVVRKIAVPGAIGQIAVATTLGALISLPFGLSLSEGLIIGIAISVASTVVLIRVLMDNDVLHTTQGHIAVGWLIVEDVFTVLVLVALPAVAEIVLGEGQGPAGIAAALGLALLKMVALAVLVLGGGRRVIPWLLAYVARTRSRELFTLSVLAIAMSIATASAYFFGVSMALGAFLAGVVVGQSEVSHQAASDALPMRDAFAVLFFVSVGMLFDPAAVIAHPGFLLALLGVTLVAKPVTAYLIVWLRHYSFRSAMTIAIALAQIGEFSFLLAYEAMDHSLLGHSSQSLLVACAMISITLNPLLFRAIEPLETWLRQRPRLWAALAARAEGGGVELNERMQERLAEKVGQQGKAPTKAVIVGYGPVGQTAARILRGFDIQPVVVDLNLETVRGLADAGQLAVYGDATRRDILDAAGIRDAKYLLATVPDVVIRTLVILTAKDMNPELRVFARARYLKEREWLEDVGATQICTEEAETAIGLAQLLLQEVGADRGRVEAELQKVQEELGVHRRAQGDFRPHYEVAFGEVGPTSRE
jgi:CPA2 family monovalent cation:H+ antiporter-2